MLCKTFILKCRNCGTGGVQNDHNASLNRVKTKWARVKSHAQYVYNDALITCVLKQKIPRSSFI